MSTVPPYVVEELVHQRVRELRKPAGRYGLLVLCTRRHRPAGQRQNRCLIQLTRTCPEDIWPRAGVAGSMAV